MPAQATGWRCSSPSSAGRRWRWASPTASCSPAAAHRRRDRRCRARSSSRRGDELGGLPRRGRAAAGAGAGDRGLLRRVRPAAHPASPSGPLEIGGYTGYGEKPMADLARSGAFTPFTSLFNVTGQPAISVPIGFGEDNLPTSVQIVGKPLGEDTLLGGRRADRGRAAGRTSARPGVRLGGAEHVGHPARAHAEPARPGRRRRASAPRASALVPGRERRRAGEQLAGRRLARSATGRDRDRGRTSAGRVQAARRPAGA